MARHWVILTGSILGLLFGDPNQTFGQPAAPTLPVTQGLIRWWPNVFDGRDVVTRQSGVLMGVFPPAVTGERDPAQFGWEHGWVQLRPAITNEVFTLCFWMRTAPERQTSTVIGLGQQSGTNAWYFASADGGLHFAISREKAVEEPAAAMPVEPGGWHHFALTRGTNGASRIWMDGRQVRGGRALPWPGNSEWLMVGNNPKGEFPLGGNIHDLCAYNRVLSDEEIARFHQAGFPNRPALNTPERAAATATTLHLIRSTNVVAVPTTAWSHQKFTTEDGLPGNIIQALLESKKGYLWIGTEDGLARYDGQHFRTFTQHNTEAMRAASHDVLCLAEESDGAIWAGTFGGLLRIRGTELTAYTNGLPQRFIQRIETAGDGSLWVFGFNHTSPRGTGMLRRYYPETGHSTVALPIPGQLRQMVVQPGGIWLATQQPDQLLFWDGQASNPSVIGRISGWPEPLRLQSDALPATATVQTWEARDKSGTNRFAELRLGPDGLAFRWHWNSNLPGADAGRWRVSPAAKDWIGANSVLGRTHSNRFELFADATHRRAAPAIVCVAAGRHGSAWFGTEEDGLHLVQERPVRVYTTDDGLPGNEVRSVAAGSNGVVWAATVDGIGRIQNGRIDPHQQGPFNAIAVRPADDLPWFGSAAGGSHALHRSTPTRPLETVLVDFAWNDPNGLRFTRDGKLWVTSRRHVAWFKPDLFQRTLGGLWQAKASEKSPAYGRFSAARELPDTGLVGLVEGRDGSMWIGTLGAGVIQLVPQGPDTYQVQRFSDPEAPLNGPCFPIYCDETGAVWFAVEQGLVRYHEQRFQTIHRTAGLPDDTFLDVIEDDSGNFWFSGKKGIHRLLRRELEAVLAGQVGPLRPLTLGIRDGLLTPECSRMYYPTMAKTPDGHLWVATRDGLATFDPSQLHLNTRLVPVSIERLTVNRAEIPLSSEAPATNRRAAPDEPVNLLRLPAGSGQRIEIEFAAISLTDADRVRFQYRLDGHDSNWSPASNLRHAFFTNLRPGAYRFRVRACNSHGIWNEAEATLDFLIRPYLWQTSALYVGIGVVLAGAALMWHWRRVRMLQRVEELKQDKAISAERARIAADMHDDLGAALTQIAILGEVTKGQLNNEERAQQSLSRISQSARDVASSISDLVWSTNPRHETLDNLAAYLREHVARQFENTPIRTQLDFPSTLPHVRLSATFRRNVLLVTKEAINNIIKHSRATVASVQMDVEPDSLSLRIADNGRGFDRAHLQRGGNGLGNMQRRIADLGGEFDLKSAPGVGTTLSFRVATEQPR